jgi:hypothetical protein
MFHWVAARLASSTGTLRTTDERRWEPVRNVSVLAIISDAVSLFGRSPPNLPEPQWQRCVAHFYRNMLSHVPKGKVADVARMSMVAARLGHIASTNWGSDVSRDANVPRRGSCLGSDQATANESAKDSCTTDGGGLGGLKPRRGIRKVPIP